MKNTPETEKSGESKIPALLETIVKTAKPEELLSAIDYLRKAYDTNFGYDSETPKNSDNCAGIPEPGKPSGYFRGC